MADRYRQTSRRRFLRTGFGALAGSTLTGCLGGSTTTDGSAATDTDRSTNRSKPSVSSDSYSVSMEPVGTVEFNEMPKTWVPYTGDYADMGVALGHGNGLSAIGVRARFGTHLYEELPGVSVDTDDLTELYQAGTGKEIFYELDADVHIIDPNFMIHRLQWSQADVDEIGNNVAPFFGNAIFTRVYGWHDYRYYSMYEALKKLAEVFQEYERYEAFKQYHDERLAAIQPRLPAETPNMALLYPADVPPESFYPYLIGAGTASKHWNDLHVGDALAQHGITDAQAGGGTIDYEALLQIDPDAIAIRLQGEITQEYFERKIVSYMRNHPVASELQAVQSDRVIYGGLTFQGPIIHFFQLEHAAHGLYPNEFDGKQLFDRKHVADIVKGEF